MGFSRSIWLQKKVGRLFFRQSAKLPEPNSGPSRPARRPSRANGQAEEGGR